MSYQVNIINENPEQITEQQETALNRLRDAFRNWPFWPFYPWFAVPQPPKGKGWRLAWVREEPSQQNQNDQE